MDDQGYTLMFAATKYNSLDVVKLLVEYGAGTWIFISTYNNFNYWMQRRKPVIITVIQSPFFRRKLQRLGN